MIEKETKQIILYSFIVIILVGLISLVYYGKIDMTTKIERAEIFCEGYNLILDVRISYSCVQIENNSVVYRRAITYIDGIKDWRWIE